MLQRLPHPRFLGAFLALFVGACSTQVEEGQTVCTDPKTGQFIACPGVSVCVDPLKGTVVPCVSGDVTFGKLDADTSDTAAEIVATDVVQDAIADVQKDTAIAETSPPDVGPADSGPVDTGPCQTGAKQCKDKNTLQTCTNGIWGANLTCPSTQECHDGACGCPDPCKALGLVECLSDVPAIKTCQMNPDKCLSWGVPIACKPGEICQNGQCKTGTTSGCNPPCSANQTCQNGVCIPNSTGGTLTCGQVVACTGNCAPGDTVCTDGCIAQGTSNGQRLFTAYKSCISAICKTYADAGQVNDAMACIYANCFDAQSACLGSGSATCNQTNSCITGCGTSATCVDACNKNSSKNGGLTYYTLYACMDSNCAGQSGDALVDCAKTQCTSSFVGCFSPIGANQTLFSCLDIATCQGKCGGDTLCAKACTAQGTPQAQADVTAFVNCRDLKCGNWCPGSTNCSPCVSQYCGYELAVCSQ